MHILIRRSTCYNDQAVTVHQVEMKEYISKAKIVNVNFESFVGALSVYTTGYGPLFQIMTGIVQVEEWPEVQQITRDMITEVDGANAGTPWGKTIEIKRDH